MEDREFACWMTGGMLGLVGLVLGGVDYINIKIAAIKAEAWVGVAREIGEGIASLGGG